MRAIGFDTVGGPEVLVEAQLPRPRPGADDVLVEVAFAGMNFAEVQHRRGEFGDPDGFDVPGLEVAGTVVQVGSRVASVRPGDVVAAYLPGFGGYAELAVTSEAFVARVPAGLAPEVAAGVPCVYPTAYGVLADAGRLAPGETVLVHAATGGVGSAAAGVARSLGASAVYGTVGSAAKLDLADRLGYDRLFERDGFAEQVLQATGGRGVDVVLDPVGGTVRDASLEVLAPFGRLVAYGDLGRSERWTADVWDLWKRNRTVAGFNIGDLARRDPARIGAHLARALDAIARGELRSPEPTTLPWTEARRAHEALERGETTGKTVLRVA